MQDIEQNMDDLIRKAAADYPLKINDSQWDDIATLLLNNPVNPTKSKKNVSKKYLILLLVFLSLLLADGIMTDTLKNKITVADIKHKNSYTKNTKTKNQRVLQYHRAEHSTLPSPFSDSSTLFSAQINQQKTIDQGVKKNKDALLQLITPSLPNSLGDDMDKTPANITSLIKANKVIEIDRAVRSKDSTNQKRDKRTIVKQRTTKQTGIYLGVLAGPLFNEIKNQGLKKTGFSGAIVAGYKFQKPISIETGLFYAKKPYFSTGQYFNMDKIGSSMPAGMEIVSLEGNNYVWELPVKMRYDFINRNKNNFFLSAGVTSYIMTYEKNNYLVKMNGTQQTMVSSYKNKSKSLAATFDIGAGYEYKIGKSIHLRIEPYLQIPLKGMGVGSMRMLSSGLRVGLIKFTN